MIPFTSAVASSFTTDIVQMPSEYEHNTEGDGNCCFSAIAFSLLTQQTIITAKLPTYFADKQLPMQAGLPQLAFARKDSGRVDTQSL